MELPSDSNSYFMQNFISVKCSSLVQYEFKIHFLLESSAHDVRLLELHNGVCGGA